MLYRSTKRRDTSLMKRSSSPPLQHQKSNRKKKRTCGSCEAPWSSRRVRGWRRGPIGRCWDSRRMWRHWRVRNLQSPPALRTIRAERAWRTKLAVWKNIFIQSYSILYHCKLLLLIFCIIETLNNFWRKIYDASLDSLECTFTFTSGFCDCEKHGGLGATGWSRPTDGTARDTRTMEIEIIKKAQAVVLSPNGTVRQSPTHIHTNVLKILLDRRALTTREKCTRVGKGIRSSQKGK